ncbi:MAG: ribonuclease E/G [Ichthyobacteriaceae bacterium]|nr:ribonuclease E/G [Ichthyobacteriaceae bacterium]
MDNEIIIRSGSKQVDIALLEEGKLTELHSEDHDISFAVGDLYLGKVKKLVPGLNAAFVDVGYEKDAFLHYHDLGPSVRSLLKFVKNTQSGKQHNSLFNNFDFEEEIHKDGKIDKVLQSGQNILVQIAKEPISTKGPRISSEISLAGRYIVLVPFSNRISVSQKIRNREEKDRLRRLIQSIKPKGFGVIIRTVAQDKKVAELDEDMTNLLKKWDMTFKAIKKENPPTRVLGELDRATAILRDIFNDSYKSIITDDEALYLEVRNYLSRIAPEKEDIVQLYYSKVPIFEKFGIERQKKILFGKSVSMSKGAYLIIEHTEALHVVDVNSGNRANSKESQENNALEVNLISATEIARQLRLRDMGGIIVVDFIDLHTAENKRKLFDHLKEQMKDDRAKHKILPPSKFGLIQITRQRVRPETNIKTREPNPDGEGEVEAPILIIDEIKTSVDRIIAKGKHSGITINTHPFVAAYLTQGFPSVRFKWFLETKKWIKILPRDAYQYLNYQIFDGDGERIKI